MYFIEAMTPNSVRICCDDVFDVIGFVFLKGKQIKKFINNNFSFFIQILFVELFSEVLQIESNGNVSCNEVFN